MQLWLTVPGSVQSCDTGACGAASGAVIGSTYLQMRSMQGSGFTRCAMLAQSGHAVPAQG